MTDNAALKKYPNECRNLSVNRFYVRKWAVKDWRVMRKPIYSHTAYTVSQHTTKQAANAAARRILEGVR